VILGGCGTPSVATEIAIDGPTPNLIYIADVDSGLQVIDIVNPNVPTRIAKISFPMDIRTIAIDGSVAYAAGDSGLFAVDISEPDDLVLIDSYTGMNYPWDIECANGLIFVSEIGRVDVFRLGPDIAEYPYVPGDINYNGATNGIDVSYAVNYFKGGALPPYSCICGEHGLMFAAGDVNGNCSFNGIDITYFVCFARGGPPLIWCADCPPISGHFHDDIKGDCLGMPVLDDTSYMVLEAIGDDLHIRHINATYQCCLEYFVEYSVVENSIVAIERDLGPQCDCICLFNLESILYDLAPGEYQVTLIGVYGDIVGMDSISISGR